MHLYLVIKFINSNKFQIPVGCVPPALYRTGGSLSRGLFQGGLCPGGLCPGGSLSGGVSVQGVSVRETPLWTVWQTSVKTLPCPKLRLRAVKRETSKVTFDGHKKRRNDWKAWFHRLREMSRCRCADVRLTTRSSLPILRVVTPVSFSSIMIGNITRKHSSRMRTARFPSYGGWGVCPSPPPWMQTPFPLDADPTWSYDLWCMLGSQPSSPLWTNITLPKLRLRAVIKHFRKYSRSYVDM